MGTVKLGGVFVSMVTAAVAVVVCPQPSVAVNVTRVVPIGRLAGALLLTARLPSCVSVAVASASQLAMAGSVTGTGPLTPKGSTIVWLAGAATEGAVFGSTTVTVELAVVVLAIPFGSPLSVTENVTVVIVPGLIEAGKSVGALLTIDALRLPSSASLAVAPFRNAAIAESLAGTEVPHRLAVTVIGLGTVKFGGVPASVDSSMVTVEEVAAVRPQPSVAEKVTVVVPTAKSAGASLLTDNTPSSASLALPLARKAVINGLLALSEVVPTGTSTVSGAGAVTVAGVFGSRAINLELAMAVSGMPLGLPLSVTEKVTRVSSPELEAGKFVGALLVMDAVRSPSSVSVAVAAFRNAWISGWLAGIEDAHRLPVTLVILWGTFNFGTLLLSLDSCMVTVAVAVDVKPQPSAVLKVTVVIPSGKSVGASLLTVKAPSSASSAVAAARNVTIDGSVAGTEVVPTATVIVKGVGAVTVGAVFGVSLTVKVESAVPIALKLSVAEKVTMVSPSGKFSGAL